MKTKYYDFQEKIDEEQLDEIIKAYKDGEVLAFPSETVYGLGANIYNDKAIEKIYLAKNRPADNPLIAHIGNSEQLNKLVEVVPKKAELLIEACWQGLLTIIFKKKKIIYEISPTGVKNKGV